jgi:succinate dehydrogenase/fumarate reductase-like Fe-S protein
MHESKSHRKANEMESNVIKVKVFRYDPAVDESPYYSHFEVPFEPGMSAMNALDYIYQHLDSSIAYYDHAGCVLGICARCTAKINGKSGLLCQTPVQGDILLEPISTSRVIRDLVVRWNK